MNRRSVVTATGSITATIATAGCLSFNPSGTKDLVVNNCLDSDETDENADKQATVHIQDDGNGATIFDETMTVPEMSCSDVVDGVDREDVFPDAGTYTVAATVDGYDRSTAQITFSERNIEDNSDNVVVSIQADEIDIG